MSLLARQFSRALRVVHVCSRVPAGKVAFVAVAYGLHQVRPLALVSHAQEHLVAHPVSPILSIKVAHNEKSTLRLVMRFLRHAFVFGPIAILFVPAYFLGGIFPRVYDYWWKLFLYALERSGPAFIKGCQWASTRQDLFPKSVCLRLGQLQESVVTHSWEHTKAVLDDAFGPGWDEKLVLEQKPIGSGCVAQVYRGKVTARVAGGGVDTRDVAVKIIHPGVQTDIHVDVALLYSVFLAVERWFPSTKWMSLSSSVDQFSKIMFQQLDLRREANSLVRFHRNFASQRDVVVPQPIPGYVRENVLVEEYVACLPMIETCQNNEALSKKLASRGFEIFMKMIFTDNFVHSDLHPGNIKLVRMAGRTGALDYRVVLLDAGITCELTPRHRKNFLDLFDAVASNQGKVAADLLLTYAPQQDCTDREGFERGITAIVEQFNGSAPGTRRKAGEILADVLDLACSYRVRIESEYASMIVGIMVLEGVGRTLDPTIDLVEMARIPIALAKAAEWYRSFTGSAA